MQVVYRWVQGAGIREVPEIEPHGCWVNLAEPTAEELSRVQTTLGLPREFLTDPLDKDERARAEYDDETNSTLMVVRVPVHDETQEAVPYVTVPFGIIISAHAVVTVCPRRTPVATAFAEQMRRVCPPENRHRFAFQLLHYAAILYLRHLREIRERADTIERDLHQAMRNEALIRLLDLEKSLVYFTTSLKANEIMISRLAHMRQLGTTPDDLDFLDDVAVEYRQAIEMATIHSNILTGMMDAFASVISNNLTVVMKFLTSITIVLMLPTLVASVYGMNVALPFQHHPHAFAITMGMSVLISLVTVILFIRRKWF